MTDIVERLRAEHWWLNVSGDEAAAEIERLRSEGANRYWEGRWRDAEAEIERLTNMVNGYQHDTRRLLEGEQHLQAEIERLRAVIVGGDEEIKRCHIEADEYRAEIERSNELISGNSARILGYQDEIERLRAEVERMHAERIALIFGPTSGPDSKYG